MNYTVKTLVVSSALIMCGVTAKAQEIAMLGQPTSPYQAQRTFSTDETTITQTVFSKPGKNRTEMNVDGTQLIQIWRTDKEVLWSLMPQQRLAMEIAMGSEQAASPLDEFSENDDMKFEMRLIGPENVNGVNANRYYISGTRKDGSRTDGHAWVTAQNITVRIRMNSSAPGETDKDFHYDLTNLSLKDQPDSLFEVPAGYQVMSLATGYPAIPGHETGAENETANPAGDYAGNVAKDAANEATREADRRVRSKARDEARKAVRKILPW